MKRITLKVIALLGATVIGNADTPKFPLYPIGGSFAPYIDESGYVHPIIDVGEIDFGSGFSLPLVLNFSSAIRARSVEFGQGWECPLLDAKVFDVQQDLKEVELLGGKRIYLGYNRRTEEWTHLYSDHWKGKGTSQDFTLSYDSEFEFTFHNGLISSLTLPGGRTILWNREGEKLVSINEVGKAPAMQVVYGKFGLVEQIILGAEQIEGVDKYVFGTDLVYAGINRIECPNKRVIAIVQSRNASNNYVLNWSDTKGPTQTLEWDGQTGKILSDDRFDYQMQETRNDKTFPIMARTGRSSKVAESFYFDPAHGTTDRLFADGTLRHVEMSQAPGPNYKSIRLVEDTRNGVTHLVLQRSFDESGRLLREALGLPNGHEDVKQYLYDETGRVTSLIWNGKEIWRNAYDPLTGELRERDLPELGVTLNFEQIGGGQIKESVRKLGGTLVSAQTLAPGTWVAQSAFMQTIH